MSAVHEKLPALAAKYGGEADTSPEEFPVLYLPRERLIEAGREFQEDPDLAINHLSDLCGLDLGDHLEVVYHFYSYSKGHQLKVKVKLDSEDKKLPTITPLWSTADWHEREVYDMFGIVFEGHPNLKRVLLAEDFPGHPLLKSFPHGNMHEYLVQ